MARAHVPGWLALVASLVFAASLAGQSDAQGDVGPREVVTPLQEPEPAAVPAALQEVWRRFAVYWEDGNARGIARLARGRRVHVVDQDRGVGARLAAGQLQYLLEEVFEGSEEVLFRFPGYAAYDPSTGSAYAVGERVYRDAPGLDPRVDRVFVGVRADRGGWFLTELRLTNR